MDFEFTEYQKTLMGSAREFVAKEGGTSLIREQMANRSGYDEKRWQRMAELGWLGVLIPEAYGGLEGEFMELAILQEAMGEACFPGPFLSTAVLGALTISLAGSESQKEQLLPRVAEGGLILSLAEKEPGGWDDAQGVATEARTEGEAYILQGTKLFVENAHVSQTILCAARTGKDGTPEEGISLFLVDPASEGVTVSVMETLGFDGQCEVVLDDVRIPAENRLGDEGTAWDTLVKVNEIAALAKCADIVGGLQTTLDSAVAYAKKREQFGKPIARFQAIQHHCADMMVDLDTLRFLTYRAAWTLDQGLPATREISMAKAWMGPASHRVTLLGHQIHGGTSFCEEMDMHLYFRRAKVAALSFGTTDDHLETVARAMGM